MSRDRPDADVEGEGNGSAQRDDSLDEQEEESFPASDPHSDWAGPGPGGE